MTSHGVRRDWPTLAKLLNRAGGHHGLRAVEIRQRWLGVRYEYGLTPAYLWTRIAGVTAALLGVVLVIVAWNRRLKREVAVRRAAEAALEESQVQLTEAQRLASVGSWTYDHESGEMSFSPEMWRILGREVGEEPPDLDSVLSVVSPEDREVFTARARGAG